MTRDGMALFISVEREWDDAGRDGLIISVENEWDDAGRDVLIISVESEWDDAGRDGRTRLARPNPQQARTETGKMKKKNYPAQLTTNRIGNHTRLIHALP